MKLISIAEFREKYFSAGSRPDVRTVRRWVEDGTVPGRVVGKLIYINEDAWRRTATGNELADRVLLSR